MTEYIWPVTLITIFFGMLALCWNAQSMLAQITLLPRVPSQPPLQPWKPIAPAIPPVVPPAPAPEPIPPPPKPQSEYVRMWQVMEINPQHQLTIDHDAKKILDFKSQYEAIATARIPWFVIGLIDIMEAGGGCKAHLHNGDPLEHRTIHVPDGRPPAPLQPPFTWETSARDALEYEGFNKITDWSIGGICAALEKYNGMGYHNRGVPSPYLWSFSNQYKSGKFVKDHEFDPNAVSEQAGAIVILKALAVLDPTIKL
jgi:lysozyme family protein